MKHVFAAAVIVGLVLGVPVAGEIVDDDVGVVKASNGGYWSGGVKKQTETREDDEVYNVCYSNQCKGACGPGCYHTGAYTSECWNHDSCIQTQRCNYGRSKWSSHYNCLGGWNGLGRAAGSAVKYHWNNWIHKARDRFGLEAWL